jgi:hypothetical protein
MSNAGALVRASRGPLVLITLGTLTAVDTSGQFSLARTWPVILIVFGLLKLAEKMAESRGGDSSGYPAPGSSYGQPPYPQGNPPYGQPPAPYQTVPVTPVSAQTVHPAAAPAMPAQPANPADPSQEGPHQ